MGPIHGQQQVGPTSGALVRTHLLSEVGWTKLTGDERDQKILKEFIRYKPASFFGKVDPLLVVDWMWKMEKILTRFGCKLMRIEFSW